MVNDIKIDALKDKYRFENLEIEERDMISRLNQLPLPDSVSRGIWEGWLPEERNKMKALWKRLKDALEKGAEEDRPSTRRKPKTEAKSRNQAKSRNEAKTAPDLSGKGVDPSDKAREGHKPGTKGRSENPEDYVHDPYDEEGKLIHIEDLMIKHIRKTG